MIELNKSNLNTMEAIRFRYRAAKARFRDERLELTALVEALQPDEIAVDVGAYKGSYLPSLSHAVPQGKVFAFEPQLKLADYLWLACESAGLDNVTIEGAGISSKQGSLTLTIPGQDSRPSPGASFESVVQQRGEGCEFMQVPVYTLDDYFAQASSRIGVLKLDVEGHEREVLLGAKTVIATHRPVILCEIEQRHLSSGSVEDVVKTFCALGYEASFACRGQWLPIDEFDPAVHQSNEGERFWDRPEYCNNFLFHPIQG